MHFNNRKRSSIESNTSLKESVNGMLMMVGRMSYGGASGANQAEARSLGTEESRTNLSNERELKRIYHRKMHIIGRDSNGALLSKQELAEIKMNQAKQVAKSLMANEKRKLQFMSKIKPVLNPADSHSKEPDESQKSILLPVARDSCSPAAPAKLLQIQSNETFHKPIPASSSPTPTMPAAANLPDVKKHYQPVQQQKRTSLDRMLTRLNNKQQ